MHNYTTVLGVIRMKENGFSVRQIRRRYLIGSSGVALIYERYRSAGLSLKDAEAMDQSKLLDIIYPDERTRRKKTPLPDYESIYQELMKKGSKVNLFFLWTEYKKDNPDGYQYSQFVEYFNRYVAQHYASKNVSLTVERIPGESLHRLGRRQAQDPS